MYIPADLCRYIVINGGEISKQLTPELWSRCVQHLQYLLPGCVRRFEGHDWMEVPERLIIQTRAWNYRRHFLGSGQEH